ncbi:MAG: ABC transporter substrate-binding protein, partial [Gemmataceae bacterium]
MAGFWSLILAGLCLTGPIQSGGSPLRWGCDQEGGAPYCFLDGKLELVGFEVDIVRELERKLGRKIRFTQYGFESLIPGLLKGDFDFAMNGLEVLPDRRQAIRFTRPYYLYRQQLTVRKGESRFSQYRELAGQTDKEVGTMDGTAAEALLIRDGVRHASYSTPTEAYRDLELGRLDAVLLDMPMARQYAAENPALAFLG